MEFTQYILLSYEVVEGMDREAAIVEATKSALKELFSFTASEASLTSEEKRQVRVLTGRQKGFFKVFVLVPSGDTKRTSKAVGQVWNPEFLRAKEVDVILDLLPLEVGSDSVTN
jgi:hypothetical protein